MMRIAAMALVGAMALLLFKQYKPEWGIPVRLVLGIFFLGMILSSLGEIASFAESLTHDGGAVSAEIWPILVKALGISFITEIAAGICRDSGEGGLALWVEMAGKMLLLVLSLPLVREVLLVAKELMSL